VIREVMQRQFLADRTATIEQTLLAGAVSDAESLEKKLDEYGLRRADVRASAEWVESLTAALKPEPRADAVFLPGDRDASLLQSALQRFFISSNLVERAQGAGAGAVVNPISDVSLSADVAQRMPKQLFGTMSESDIGWASCLFAKAYRMIGKRRSFPDRAAAPRTVDDNARVYLIADWGSGIARAKKIADRIRTMMLADTTREQHVIHLGDVYYSGWPEEYDDHFLANWPVRPGEEHRYGSWCLNANHDMFSGGYGYFDYLLKDKRFAAQQGKSYFSLATSRWQMLGLDSAWTDGSLAGSQVEWVGSVQKAAPDKKLLLMTHHQPFSSFGERSCPDLQVLLAKNKVTAWFWGHEHRFAKYQSRPDLKYARLIGHGGVPVWRDVPWKFWTSKDPEGVTFVSREAFRSGLEWFLLFGFAVLDFDGEAIRVRYFYENGDEEKAETLI
jgi:Calcineurin-like phosphoesterase